MKWIKITVVNVVSAGLMGLLLDLILNLGKAHPGDQLVLMAPIILFVLVMIGTCVLSGLIPMIFGDGTAMDREVKLSMGMWGVFSMLIVTQQLLLFVMK